MGALVQTLPHHHRLRPAKEGSAPSSPVPGFFDRPAFRRINSLRSRSGPQSCSPLDQAHPLRGSRDFYTRAFLTAGHPTAKSGITTQLSGLLLRRNLHPLGKCCYGLQLRSAGITPPPRYLGPVRHPLVVSRFPGGTGYTAYPAPPISRRDEEGFSSGCSTCPGHRAVAPTPPEGSRRVSQTATIPAAFARTGHARPPGLGVFEATSAFTQVTARQLAHHPSDGRVERWRAHGRVRWHIHGFRRGPQSGSHGDVSSALPKIPDVEFSPVRLQAEVSESTTPFPRGRQGKAPDPHALSDIPV